VCQETIAFEVESDDTWTHLADYSESNLLEATLQAGHEYVILAQFEGVSTSILGALAEVESGKPNMYLYSDWDSIAINF